jgi:hypothetical protein
MKGSLTGQVRQLIAGAVSALAFLFVPSAAPAASWYQQGHIASVQFVTTSVLISVDSGLPDNCAGTSWGRLEIPQSYKPLQALVLGMWMRGDMNAVTVIVYTSGIGSDGYCQVVQIDVF